MEIKRGKSMEAKILKQIGLAMQQSITQELVGYNKPLSLLTQKVVAANEDALYTFINKEFSTLINSVDFKEQLKLALNTKLAKTVVARMGGEVEKRVNELKNDPALKARLTIAINDVLG
jgi:hypothetical protein